MTTKKIEQENITAVNNATRNMHFDLWQTNITENSLLFGFGQTIKVLKDIHKNEKVIVFAAGVHPDWQNRNNLERIYSAKKRPLVIACDCSLPLFAELGYTPDYVVSADGSPLIAKYYWRKLRGKPKGALLCTTVHPTTTETITQYGWPIYWMQNYSPEELRLDNIPSILPVGNVGSTAWLVAWYLGCKPIGLLDIEFAWSDEVPYRAVGERFQRAGYKTYLNPIAHRYYMADYIYSVYLDVFAHCIRSGSAIGKHTVSLTKEGIICKSGIKYKSLESFLADTPRSK